MLACRLEIPTKRLRTDANDPAFDSILISLEQQAAVQCRHKMTASNELNCSPKS